MKTILKPCSLEAAIKAVATEQEAYIFTPITEATTVGELLNAVKFGMFAPVETPEQPKAVKPAPKKTAAKPGIDHGKIIALHRAGWSTAKIADEMGCTTQTVRNHLAEEADEPGKDAEH